MNELSWRLQIHWDNQEVELREGLTGVYLKAWLAVLYDHPHVVEFTVTQEGLECSYSELSSSSSDSSSTSPSSSPSAPS